MKMFELEGATTKQTDEERRNALPQSEYFEPPRDHVEDPKPSSMSGKLFALSNIPFQFEVLVLNICSNDTLIKYLCISGVKTFFLLLLGVLACFACVVIGIMIYQKQQENSRKRFY